MAEITVVQLDDQKGWENFLASHPEANFLQSWYWGEFRQALKQKIFRIGFIKNGKLIGTMLAVIEDAKRGRYLTVPAGPIIDWQNQDIVDRFLTELKRIAKQESCVFVRVRPQLLDDEFSRQLFAKLGFQPAPSHLHAELTSQLEIDKSEEELLAQMRKNTRYEIRKALSLGIKVTASEDPEAIKSFFNLQAETAKRQDFVPFSYEFLYEQFKIFAGNNKALLYSAEHNGQLLAQAFIIFYGQEAAYHYGASSEAGRKYPGAYLLQWEAIKEAKKRGLKIYNFWGVAPEGQSKHRFSGLSLFKRGFGGKDLAYLPAHDLVINHPLYLINSAIENTRKHLRHL